jgi:hypothetical protein
VGWSAGVEIGVLTGGIWFVVVEGRSTYLESVGQEVRAGDGRGWEGIRRAAERRLISAVSCCVSRGGDAKTLVSGCLAGGGDVGVDASVQVHAVSVGK